MGEFFQVAARLLLTDTFERAKVSDSNLSCLLSKHCRTQEEFQWVMIAVLETLDGWPVTVVRRADSGLITPLLDGKAMTELVDAVKAEVYWLVTGVCEEIASSSLRYEDGMLYIRGRLVAEWRKEEPTNRRQTVVLEAFQSAGWDEWIQNPFDPEEMAEQTCKNLNKKLKKWLHFQYHWDRLHWTWAKTSTPN